MRYLCRLLAAIIILAPLAYADIVPERPTHYVTDLAGVVDDPVERKLNGYLQELEQKTTAQVLVLTINSLEGAAIETYSLNVAEKWLLGQKGKDNGLLVLFAMQDRKYRFEVGYGLEGILPDSRVGSIGRQYVVPFFRKGEYSNGVTAATLAVVEAIAADSGVEITGMPKLSRSAGGRGPESIGLGEAIIALLLLAGLGYLFVKHPRMLLLLILFSGMGGGRRSHWGGGHGGGFGGGFGGFGGGGGGGFGGGGASGGW